MRKTTNKVISLMMVWVMALSICSIQVFANNDTITAQVQVVINNEVAIDKSVTVAKTPQKPYIPEDITDSLAGAASVYDAILAAVGSDNISATWGQYGIFINTVTVNDTQYKEVADTPIVNDEYSKYSGKGWTYTLDGKSPGAMSGEALTEGSKIVFTYAPYNFENGVYRVSLKTNTPDGVKTHDITVPLKPTKDYLTEADPLDGAASPYDALLLAVGADNVVMKNAFITAITVDTVEYKGKDNEMKSLFDMAYIVSSGFAWTYTVNGVFADEYSTQRKIEYGDVIEFTYGPWTYCMDGTDYSEIKTPYVSSGIKLTDLTGKPATGLESGVMANFEVARLTNKQSDMYSEYIILAGYDENDLLVSFGYMGANIDWLKPTKFGSMINVPQGKKLAKVKAMVWDGLDTMQPLAEGKIYTEGE